MPQIKLTPNEWRKLEKTIKWETYQRFPVKTHRIHIKEDISPILEYIASESKKGDWVAISERFMTISEWRLIHQSFLKPSRLAMVIYRAIRFNMGEKAFHHDPWHAIPKKLQACILIAWWRRMFFALVLGIPLTAIWKLFGKKKGRFYIIAWHRISEIDGSFTKETPPFNEFAKIYPENPEKTCNEIEKKFWIPAIITDGNNIDTEILGMSRWVPVSKTLAKQILLDNPMGQGKEQTPIILVREKNKKSIDKIK